jgi:hypothetical protein
MFGVVFLILPKAFERNTSVGLRIGGNIRFFKFWNKEAVMAEYVRKKKNWWIKWWVIWAIIYVLSLFLYPSKPSFWGGWLPNTVFYTFGLMVVIFVLASIFSLSRYKNKSE